MSFAVTIDFHDTLFRCDAWFELEVRDLPSRFLAWRARRDRMPLDEDVAAVAGARYRDLRAEIKGHGREDDAVGCLRHVFGQMRHPVTESDLHVGVDALFDALPPGELMPGARDALTELWREEITLGIVSSAIHTPYLLRSVEASGLGQIIESVATSASTGYYKSRPDIYTVALEAMGAETGRSVHVGDSLEFDVRCAARAGMRTAWLANGRSLEVDDPVPDVVLPTWSGAAEAILSTLRGSVTPHRSDARLTNPITGPGTTA